MRVVAGSARGRRLVTPEGRDTRPTGDRVRQAVFNSLTSIDAVAGAVVLDLYAGSGALGIEALSRGAAHATFVERSSPALAAIRSNLAVTGFDRQATVIQADALSWLPPGGSVDLALVDPPYAFGEWPSLLDRVGAGIVVAESDREIVAPTGWVSRRVKRYGTTVVTFLHALDPERDPGE
jgi:16S rRNA (guanine966-N2)-methyltransferase